MGDAQLERLEKLRRETVDRARAALAEAERERRARNVVYQQAVAVCTQREAAVRAARETFAASSTVAGLRAASGMTAVAEAALVADRARAARAEQAQVEAAALLKVREAALQRAELERRAIVRTLARSERQRALRHERRLEDEADDLARARMRR